MPIAKDYSNEQVDLSQVYKMPELRLADFLSKLYDLGTGVTFSVTSRGCISITIFAKPKNIKVYIEDEAEAASMFEAAITEAMKRAR